ncbi:leukotriene B4 receptor 2a [Ictalurus punctatus]|uniref:Leukotriene B4 receptor 1 n=1 Tax=Ictalurus punctatus TaxID=7998 RepID=W5UI32_ICTPU|nr:leukotriene B4 receptor 2a [Ictalurus punctatus]XP_053533392.1 leukotriene B4 receptor 2a [Ictalurus punctatus]XP_053533393.1 leukotriene B4 receptor 2a [Ictalurus punctatus]
MAFMPTPGLNFSSRLPNTTSTSATTTILSSKEGTIVAAVILSIAFLLGIPGNLFVIWSIMARTRRPSVTTTLILNLACADGMLMLLTPFFVIYLVQRSWIFGQTMCKVLYYFCCANMYASIFLITLMSLHRLVAVVWPHRIATLSMRNTVLQTLLVIWILALALAVPVLKFRDISNSTAEKIVCDCLHSEPGYAVMQYSMETVLGFLLPYGVILVSYRRVLLRIRRTRFQRRIRSEKLILFIVLTFALFWLPYHVVNVLQVTEAFLGDSNSKIHKIRTLLRPFAAAVAFVSSCINPILYMYVGKAYMRRAGMGFMARLFEATGRDSASRKSQNQQRELGENDGLRDKESESTTSVNTSSNVKTTRVQNGTRGDI